MGRQWPFPLTDNHHQPNPPYLSEEKIKNQTTPGEDVDVVEYKPNHLNNMLTVTSRKLPWFLFATVLCSCSSACVFTVSNDCPYTIWPATLAGAGTTPLPMTGFELNSGQTVRIPSVPGWSGRIWARTGCTFDALGAGTCQTGDCGGRLECDGVGAAPPASLFEITLGTGDLKDFYDVSFVDGYNLPLIAAPRTVYGGCNATGCAQDINIGCPKELQVVDGDAGVGGVVACKSACGAFGMDQYCCSGEFANPTTCRPSFYSAIFKRACPRAYSYAFDDGTSTFTCKAYEYSIIFCPNTNNGIRRTDGALTAPRAEEGRNWKSAVSVSTSNALVPIPISVLILGLVLLGIPGRCITLFL